jgi:RNA-binding protein NOB1
MRRAIHSEVPSRSYSVDLKDHQIIRKTWNDNLTIKMPEASAAPSEHRPVHTIILDSSPLLLNTPGISTLLANTHVLVTTPSVLAEIKSEEAKARVDTLYMPFLTVCSPKPESIKFVKEFAKKTGDSVSLSQTDYEVLALAYDLECERNGGDWRLRNKPGQKRMNGSPPKKDAVEGEVKEEEKAAEEESTQQTDTQEVEASLEGMRISEIAAHTQDTIQSSTDNPSPVPEPSQPEYDSSSDSDGGWITPSNIQKHQIKDSPANNTTAPQRTLQVATMTGDFALQNVLLQINLNLLSTKTCKRITSIKQFLLRCHGCFATTRDTSKQFCPRCGQPTLTRVTCTTNDRGEVKLHLKRDMQWNNRGNVYSIPKAGTGNASQRWKGSKSGGGQGGWGNELILAEDQKEFVRAVGAEKRMKGRDLMDDDTLPGLLTGDRGREGGRVRVGAGRNINSRKR